MTRLLPIWACIIRPGGGLLGCQPQGGRPDFVQAGGGRSRQQGQQADLYPLARLDDGRGAGRGAEAGDDGADLDGGGLVGVAVVEGEGDKWKGAGVQVVAVGGGEGG